MNSHAKTVMHAVKGQLVHGDPSALFKGISIDSRSAMRGELFFCIKGEKFDGHDFIHDAISGNVSGIVFSDREKLKAARLRPDGPFAIHVADTIRALQDLAAFHRRLFPVRVVGVTGSNGKSTTKEMIAAIAATAHKTLKNKGNLNNHIGLPLSLFGLNKEHGLAVLEMGMSAAGEIRRLAEIALPEIGVITNIFPAHLVELKDVRSVQSAKGELFAALGREGTAIVNADDPLVLELAGKLRSRVVTFGVDKPADVTAADIRFRKNTGFDFTVRLFDDKFPLFLPLLSYGGIYNALAAVAVGHALGIAPDNMTTGLGRSAQLAQRGEILTHNSMTILDDSYNANPGSMQDALDTLTRFQTDGRKFFVMGDMLELGEFSERAHIELGQKIANCPVDYLVTVGTLAGLAGDSARKTGMAQDRIIATENHQQAADYLSSQAAPGDFLVFKGSRSTHMEKVIETLTSSPTK